MKKLLIILLVSIFVLSGCTKKADTDNTNAEVKPVNIPDAVLGYYYEEIAGRGVLNLEEKKEGYGTITIDWGSSAYENAHWDIEAIYDGKQLNYTNGSHIIQTFENQSDHTDTLVYSDGSGYFETKQDSIVWHNDKKDNGDEDVVFVREREPKETIDGMPNPWVETTDLNVAIKNAGVEFGPPIDEALPNDVKLKTYLSTFGTISAMYEGGGDTLTIRKSTTSQDKELTGDFNEYSKTWKHSFKGLIIEFEGDGELANNGWFTIDDEHYAISFNPGQEGKGLTMDQVNSMINGMESSGPSK